MEVAAPHDRPLSVERLTPDDLAGAVRAVAAIVAVGHGIVPLHGRPPFSLVVHWEEDASGEQWVVSLAGIAAPLDHAKALAAADHLLQPILRLMRPRRIRHFYRSQMDELSPEEMDNLLAAMAQAMSMPSPEYTEPRWVEDRTVVDIAAPSEIGPAMFSESLTLLGRIAAGAAASPTQ